MPNNSRQRTRAEVLVDLIYKTPFPREQAFGQEERLLRLPEVRVRLRWEKELKTLPFAEVLPAVYNRVSGFSMLCGMDHYPDPEFMLWRVWDHHVEGPENPQKGKVLSALFKNAFHHYEPPRSDVEMHLPTLKLSLLIAAVGTHPCEDTFPGLRTLAVRANYLRSSALSVLYEREKAKAIPLILRCARLSDDLERSRCLSVLLSPLSDTRLTREALSYCFACLREQIEKPNGHPEELAGLLNHYLKVFSLPEESVAHAAAFRQLPKRMLQWWEKQRT